MARGRAYGAGMTEPHHVLIAGGGVGGLEAMLALRDLAGDRVRLALLTPDEHFVVRALSVEDPFARPLARRHALEDLCAEAGAELVRDELAAVDAGERRVTTASGAQLTYDALLVAVGARAEPAFSGCITFHGFEDAERVHGLVQDVEVGAVTSIAFVVPIGVSWPLPIYELALQTADRAHDMGIDVTITIVTPEERPLGIFGVHASDVVAELLAGAGIDVRTNVGVREIDHGTVTAVDGTTVVEAQRAVALPTLHGPAVPGLPADREGFIPIDEHGRVHGTTGVWAAGDGTTFPLKQGGIAAQQADAVAEAIAQEAGAPVTPQPFRPQLRAKLLTGGRPTFLSEMIVGGGGAGTSTASEEPPWWPPTKIAAKYLGPYLERAERA